MADLSNKCPLCGRRKADRFCPAKGEKICAVCCGSEREVSIDCPSDCSYLIAAHRYEQEHRKPPASAAPFPDMRLSQDLLYEQQALLRGLSSVIAGVSRERRELTDSDALLAISTLAETYRTLSSGIYYEKPPAGGPASALYSALGSFTGNMNKEAASRSGSTVKDSDAYHSLVFLARLCWTRTNGRPRSRMFLEQLRSQFPPAEGQREVSRIITP
jgi:hypothetical protein